jgi:uncharacterized protein YndB with AHSA1/START domain
MPEVARSTDRIEKRISLRAPRARVWRAIADARQFGEWFRVDFKGATFAPGATVRGNITYPGYEHMTMEIVIERMDPERLFSYRWHPYAVEPTTLVEFHLADIDGGTQLTVVESGFDRLPLARRAIAYRMNDQGWAEQITNIARYVAA